MYHKCVVGAVDWKPRWVRAVVCSDVGGELARALWPSDEAADHLVRFFQLQRETYGVPLVVTGRCRAPWPNELLQQFWLAGFTVELYDGAPLGKMLRLEHGYRDDPAFRVAALLAAIHVARRKQHGVGELETFVLRWSVEQARQRLDELVLELQSSQPCEWRENWTEDSSSWSTPCPVVFSDQVRLSVSPMPSATMVAEAGL